MAFWVVTLKFKIVTCMSRFPVDRKGEVTGGSSGNLKIQEGKLHVLFFFHSELDELIQRI